MNASSSKKENRGAHYPQLLEVDRDHNLVNDSSWHNNPIIIFRLDISNPNCGESLELHPYEEIPYLFSVIDLIP